MKIYKFTSTDTMTAQEVADLLQVMIVSLLQAIQQRAPTGAEPLEIDEAIYNHMSPELQRYFSLSQPPAIDPTSIPIQ